MEETLVIVKPDAFAKRYTWDIIKEYSSAGLDVSKIKIEVPDRKLCEEHYIEHIGKPYFEELISFLSSGPVCVMILTGENAISKVRELNGCTNPKEAKSETIRSRYGESKTRNAVHASDCIEHAKREIALWF